MYIGLTIGQITKMVGGSTSLDHSFFVKNIASLSQAGLQDLAIVFQRGDASVFDDVSQNEIKKSKAGLILAAKSIVPEKNYLVVKDPLKAYKTLILAINKKEHFSKKESLIDKSAVIKDGVVWSDNVFIGASVVVQERTTIGDGTHIGSQSYIGQDCVIGKNVLIHPGVKILDRTVIGDESIIHSGVVIGSDGFGYQVTKTGMNKIPQIGNVKLGSFVEIGANSAIDRAAFGSTIIGDGTKIDNMVHIAHGVVIGPHTAILAQTAIAGVAKIGAGCQIGGQVGIKDHVTIGNGVKIVSKSAVMCDVSDGLVVAGTPSMPFSQWKRMLVASKKLPEMIQKAKKIEKMFEGKKRCNLWQRLFG